VDVHLSQDIIIVLGKVILSRTRRKLSIVDNLLVDEGSLSLVICYEHGVNAAILQLTLVIIL